MSTIPRPAQLPRPLGPATQPSIRPPQRTRPPAMGPRPMGEEEEGRGDRTSLCQQRGQKVHHTLIKKKIKFSSYIMNFRMEQLQSHI
jgi:hypothetical protein